MPLPKLSYRTNIRVLAEDIQKAYGIDIRQYARPELAEHLLEIIVPLNLVLRFLIWFSGTLLLGWLFVFLLHASGSGWFGFFLWSLAAMVSAAISGLTWGLFGVVRGLFSNFSGLLSTALDIVETAIKDIEAPSNPNRKKIRGSLTLLVKGAIFLVMLPTLEAVLRKKFKFLAKPLTWSIQRSFSFACRRIEKAEQPLQPNIHEKAETPEEMKKAPSSHQTQSHPVQKKATAAEAGPHVHHDQVPAVDQSSSTRKEAPQVPRTGEDGRQDQPGESAAPSALQRLAPIRHFMLGITRGIGRVVQLPFLLIALALTALCFLPYVLVTLL